MCDCGQWQSIESAPKDGTRIGFLDAASGRFAAVRWDAITHRFITDQGYSTGYNDAIAWSHWMPLPTPPSTEEGK